MKHMLWSLATTMLISIGASAQSVLPLKDDASRGELFDLMRSYEQEKAPPEEREKFAFPLTFRFPHDALWKNPVLEQDPRSGQLFGIDLSHHNVDKCHCKVEWEKLSKQQIGFAYLKASQGINSVDGRFDEYRNGARSLAAPSKIYVGAYHFLSANGAANQQAANFLRVIHKKLAPDDLPPTLDLEWDVRIKDGKVILGSDGKPYDHWTPVNGDEILARALTWLDSVAKSTGRTPLVYTNREWWLQRIGDEKKMEVLSKYPIWIADYSKTGRGTENPAVPNNASWRFWQFSSTAGLSAGGLGIGQVVDANVFSGTLNDFLQQFGIAK